MACKVRAEQDRTAAERALSCSFFAARKCPRTERAVALSLGEVPVPQVDKHRSPVDKAQGVIRIRGGPSDLVDEIAQDIVTPARVVLSASR